MQNEPLPYTGTWPDEIRSVDDWACAGPFHYVSIEDNENYFSHKVNESADIIKALAYFADIAARKHSNEPERKRRQVAIKWVNHLIGDLHQPLHVGRACDRGGNSIRVTYFNRARKLHQVWDEDLIDYSHLSFSEYAEMINHPAPDRIKAWQGTSLVQWAIESQNLRNKVYTCMKKDGCTCPGGEKCNANIPVQTYKMCKNENAENIQLYFRYQYQSSKIVRKRLIQAGVRLGHVLNEILENRNPFKDLQQKLQKENPAWSSEIDTCVQSAIKSVE